MRLMIVDFTNVNTNIEIIVVGAIVMTKLTIPQKHRARIAFQGWDRSFHPSVEYW